jgi:hypothetical protein
MYALTRVTDAAFVWQSSGRYSTQAGLDGTLAACDTSAGGTSLSGAFASHSVRLETSCTGCGQSDMFELLGVKLKTQVVVSG